MAGPQSVSVIMPAYEAAQDVGEQLEALAAQTYDGEFQLIVSDNGSRDATVKLVRAWSTRFGGMEVVDSSDRRGPSHARNVGAAAAKGDIFAFCDSDDVVSPTWLAELVAVTQEADIVGGGLDHELLNPPEVSAWRGETGQAGSPSPLHFLPYALSGNMAVRADVWRALGGLREEYRYCEDVEFSWRAQLAGYRVDHAPAAVVHYRHRSSMIGVARQVYRYGRAEARLYRDYRHYGARRRDLSELAGAYAHLATRLPFLVMSRRRRGYWVITASQNLGKAVGSYRERVFCP